MAARQGSASFTIVLAGVTALVTWGILLTFLMYPIVNAFLDAAFWNAETVAGSRILTYTRGVWTFWGAILLMALLSFIWVRTRQ